MPTNNSNNPENNVDPSEQPLGVDPSEQPLGVDPSEQPTGVDPSEREKEGGSGERSE
jgi:hypothetical protein